MKHKGGYSYETNGVYTVTEYNTKTFKFSNHPDIDSNTRLFGSSYYTQINDTLYMISPDLSTSLSTYNLRTKTYTKNWRNIVLNVDVEKYGCPSWRTLVKAVSDPIGCDDSEAAIINS